MKEKTIKIILPESKFADAVLTALEKDAGKKPIIPEIIKHCERAMAKLKKATGVVLIASTLCSSALAAAPSGRPCTYCANPSPTIIHGTAQPPKSDNTKAIAVAAVGFAVIAILIAAQPSNNNPGHIRLMQF